MTVASTNADTPPSDDFAARVIAFVARETDMPTEPAHGLYVLCDERRENVDYMLNKFKEEFNVDMSEFNYDLAFPPSPPGNAWPLIGAFFGSVILAMTIGMLLWAKIGEWIGLASLLPLWIASMFLIAGLMERFQRRSGHRDLWRYPDNAATVQTLIDSARAKRWTYRLEKASTP